MKKPFVAPYTVTIGDINYGRHLGNDRSFILFQEARIRFFEEFNFTEANIGDGAGIIVVEVGAKFLREVLLHDELEIQVVVGEVVGKKLTLHYTVVRKSDGQQVITGFTSILAYNRTLKKVVELPGQFLAACRQ